ncbi:hypothetical protein HELRODRAFT_83543, partial [Helobdella robusta]|uniref:Translational activator of cytochrome c oxidase 1 n=1 Tax=Helobdella robusta TaxID=6412 RepID=T1G569_HELRO
AGHSHWKNIKETKELKDAQKQKTFSLVIRKIKIAVQGNGSTNPKLNSFLAKVLEEAKAKDIPSSTINTALQRFKGPQFFVEGRALSGCSVIVESFSDKPKWFRQSVQHILKTYGGRIADAGSCCHMFDYKGVIYVPGTSTDNSRVLNYDKAFELAIEAGAEEVVEDSDENDEKIFKFICETKELHQVRKSLIDLSLHPYEARLEHIPHTFVNIEKENVDVALKLVGDLEALEDASQVFHNIQVAQT